MGVAGRAMQGGHCRVAVLECELRGGSCGVGVAEWEIWGGSSRVRAAERQLLGGNFGEEVCGMGAAGLKSGVGIAELVLQIEPCRYQPNKSGGRFFTSKQEYDFGEKSN